MSNSLQASCIFSVQADGKTYAARTKEESFIGLYFDLLSLRWNSLVNIFSAHQNF